MLIPFSPTVEAPQCIADHVLCVKNIGESSNPQPVVSSTEPSIAATEFSGAGGNVLEPPPEEATLLTEVSCPRQTSSISLATDKGRVISALV